MRRGQPPLRAAATRAALTLLAVLATLTRGAGAQLAIEITSTDGARAARGLLHCTRGLGARAARHPC